jgi:hypothetical protein
VISGFRQLPDGARNGLPGFHDYAYRGAKPLVAELQFLCEAGCGRRLETNRFQPCAVCRGTEYHPPGKCARCGYKPGSRNCRALCGVPAAATST